jgi:hypothetical protein
MFDVARFSLRIKLYKLTDQAVFIQALLSELLNKSGATGATVVQGYCTAYGESCYHVWVEDDKGTVTDVIQYLFPEYQNVTLSKEPIEGAQKDQLTVDLYELFKSDQKEFWKKAPKKFLDFRSKCHAHLSKSSR